MQTSSPNKEKKNNDRLEFCLSGTGGQGLILAGIILGEAATLFEEKKAIQTQSYGPEARGGASRSEVVVSSNEIFYPKTMDIDVLLAMSQQALDNYGKLVCSDKLFIIDNTYIKNIPPHCKNIFKAPFTQLAVTNCGKSIVANIIALSAVVAITKVVAKKSLTKAVEDRVPNKALDINRQAIDIGFNIVAEQNFVWQK